MSNRVKKNSTHFQNDQLIKSNTSFKQLFTGTADCFAHAEGEESLK